LELGSARASAAGRRSRRCERRFIRHAGRAPKMAQAKSLSLAGLSSSALPLSLYFLSWISRWRAGTYILHISSGADVPFQGQNLRTEARTRDREGLTPCAALAAS